LNYEEKRRTFIIKKNGMKEYLLKTAGAAALLAMVTTGAGAQEKGTTTIHRNNDVIIIRPKVNVDTKLNIEIKGDDIKVNGKPLSEYKSDDVNISRQKHLDVNIENREMSELDEFRAPRPATRFRSGANVYSYGGDNFVTVNDNKAFLGVGTEKVEEGEGVIINSITDESGAEKAGLKEGDIITKINDIKISSPQELTKTIGKFNPDEKITVTYKRDKKETKTTATLTKRKTMAYTLASPRYETMKSFNFDNGSNFNFNWNGKPRLGLKAQETEDGKGLKVLDVDDESTAEKAGIKEGDIITSFDGTEVNTVEKLGELAKGAIDKGNFKVKITRDGKPQELDVKIPKKLKTTSL
jgi:serine protease Do